MENEIGTRVNLREILSGDGLKKIHKGDVLHFEREDKTDTWVKVIRAGFWRYEGEIIEAPKTHEELQKEADRVIEEPEIVTEKQPKPDFTIPKATWPAGEAEAKPKRTRKKKEVL